MEPTRYLLVATRFKRGYEAACQPVCRQYGLLQIDFDVLAFLHNNPGFDTARDIVELRMLQKGNVSAAVERLIRAGLLSRHPDPADRRLIHLRLEPAAAPVLAEITAAQQEFGRRLLACLTPEERETYRRLTDKLAAASQSLAKGPETPC